MGPLSQNTALSTLAYNTAATQPHQNCERPVKVKLTQTKKIVASGMSEAEAIERAKLGDAEAFEFCTACTNGEFIRCVSA